METLEDLKKENEALKERVNELEETVTLCTNRYLSISEKFNRFKDMVKNLAILAE